MADYKETTISGNSWTRCNKIEIDNTYGRNPGLHFHEEKRMIINDDTVGIPQGGMFIQFNPDEVIELRDPDTMAKTGSSIRQLDLYVMLYSAYIQEALARDERNNPAPEPEITEPLPEDPTGEV